MVSHKENKNAKIPRMSIFLKLILFSAISTVIPIIITGTLIIFSYQEVVNRFLSEQGTELISGVDRTLLLTLYNIRIQAVLTLFIIIVLTLFSSVLMARNFTRPLRNLIKGTKEVTKGNLDCVINVETRDELGELAKHFNMMTRQLKKANLAFEEVKAALEIRVEARTRELKELAENLEDQIRERTGDLQKRVLELERLHKLTVGRELKMIELKKEIKKLKEELEVKKGRE